MKSDFYEVNSYYEGLIQNFYAGSSGCFVGLMQFFYQYNQAKIYNPALEQCFKELFELETQNCEILSELIIKMGGDNKFYSCSRKYLSGSNVDYVKNFEKIFLSDIELLEISVIECKSIIAKIENENIKGMLKQVLSNKKNALKKLKENYFKISTK